MNAGRRIEDIMQSCHSLQFDDDDDDDDDDEPAVEVTFLGPLPAAQCDTEREHDHVQQTRLEHSCKSNSSTQAVQLHVSAFKTQVVERNV
jgi:hypothetical protein